MKGKRGSTNARACSILVNWAKPKPLEEPYKNPKTKVVNACAEADTKLQVPDDFSRIIVTVSTLQPLETRYA